MKNLILKTLKNKINSIKSMSALKILLFGNGSYQGLRQLLNTFCMDPLTISIQRAKLIESQCKIIDSLDLTDTVEFNGSPFKELKELIFSLLINFIDGNYNSIGDPKDEIERIFVLKGFIFGDHAIGYQGLKQSFISFEKLESAQVKKQIQVIHSNYD